MKRFKHGFLICLLLFIVFISFTPSLRNSFVTYDDDEYITANSYIKSVSFDNIKKICSSPFIGNYQPVTILTYLIEYHLFRLNPFGYHMVSLLLHLLNCLLVLWFIYLLCGKFSVSLIGAALFGIHPLRVESVAWASEQKDVLYAFFFLSSLISYIYYLRGHRYVKYYFLSLSLFVLSLLAKPMAVTLPLVLILIDYLNRRRVDRMSVQDKIPFFFFSLTAGLLAICTQSAVGALHERFSFDIVGRSVAASYAVIFYISKIVLPINLSCIYPYPGSNAYIFIYAVIITALICILFFLGRHSRKIIFSGAFFLITILPVLKLISFGPVIAADRYTYIPSVGISYGISEAIVWLWTRQSHNGKVIHFFTGTFFLTVMILFSVLTWRQCGVWEDGISLWSNALRYYPHAAIAYANRGVAYFRKGDYDQTISECGRAIKLKPRDSCSYLNRASAYYNKGNYDAAFLDYKKAAVIDPKYSHYPDFVMASAYLNSGKPDMAIEGYTKVIDMLPRFGEVYKKRAVAYFINKQYDKSWDDVHRAQALDYVVDPDFIEDLKMASRREK